MKNAFLVSTLILAAAYSAAAAASTFGIVPTFRLPSIPAVIGAYAAIGIVAFAFRDYARPSRTRVCPLHIRLPRASQRPAVPALSLTNRSLHAN